ncbi:MAG: glycerol-3-phosphate 1-O-acyltransferase PlsY [Peptostreptococcaceae bacterium]
MLLIILVSYLLGSISTSYLIAKKYAGIDIRTQGSGNAGSTNVLRTLGKKAGICTFLGDFFKGSFAVLIAKYLGEKFGIDSITAGYLAVAFVVLGHNYPVFLGFKGGKGVATTVGSMITINPIIASICIGVFIVILATTKYVSLASIIAISSSSLIMLFIKNYQAFFITLFLSALTIYSHRENIKRLINGTERKIGQKKD